MFRPIRVLKFGAVLYLITGCASGGTAHDSNRTDASATNAAVHATATITKTESRFTAPAAIPSIQAGSSTPGMSGFTQDNGQLKPDIQAYANEVARTRNIPQRELEALLRNAQYNTTAVRLMTPSKTRIRRSWVTYRERFVEPVRLKAGVEFWQQHAKQLSQTERQYGVPASVIVAIIGVETIFGRYTGDFRVLDALTTLGFRYPDASRPERSQLFRDQLADLAQLHHEKKLDAYTVTGSFAGAMGLPQFMPGSLLRYAVDGDGDGRIDLLDSPADAITSVASFLRYHGWVPGLPIFAPVQLPAQPQKLVAGGIDPTLNWQTLVENGATIRSDAKTMAWKDHKLGVIDLVDEPRNTVEYRTGTPNFFAITHYNRSYFYATAVTELAEALAKRMTRDQERQTN